MSGFIITLMKHEVHLEVSLGRILLNLVTLFINVLLPAFVLATIIISYGLSSIYYNYSFSKFLFSSSFVF
jgi:hypothetical protein